MRQNNSYRAFWPQYVNAHRNKTCRTFHFVGTALTIFCFAMLFVSGSAWWLLGMALAGYGFAWTGHFLFERNRPLTFTHPLSSLVADFHMFALMCLGRMEREVQRTPANPQ